MTDILALDDDILLRDYGIKVDVDFLWEADDRGMTYSVWRCILHNEFDGGALVYREYRSSTKPCGVDVVADIYRKVEGIHDRSYFDWCELTLRDPERIASFEAYRRAWDLYQDWRCVFRDYADLSDIDGIEEYI